MPRRRRPHKFHPRKALRRQQPQPSFFLLDQFTLDDLNRWTSLRDKILQYHWEYYGSLAYQRSRVTDEIKAALLEAANRPFKFSQWQRVVKHKYAVEPLSVSGSLADVGGRFNIGDIDHARFPPFPALYIASDRPTALQESLGQDQPLGSNLNALELALTKPTSIASVSLSGSLDAVIDLNRPDRLHRFMDLIKDFVVPGRLTETMREVGWASPELIRTVPKLMQVLLDPKWREWPMLYEVPIASQIFGRLVADAGIEGILYPSKFSGKGCLAVFPQNLTNESHVVLDDEPPPETTLRRLDAKTWRERGQLL